MNNARWEDLDMDLVEDYVRVIGYGKGAETYLRENGYMVKMEDYGGRVGGGTAVETQREIRAMKPGPSAKMIQNDELDAAGKASNRIELKEIIDNP